MPSQLAWTKEQLLTTGQVSRNAALKLYFTRLAARVEDLRKEGMVIEGKKVKTVYGEDYVYYLKKEPEQLTIHV